MNIFIKIYFIGWIVISAIAQYELYTYAGIYDWEDVVASIVFGNVLGLIWPITIIAHYISFIIMIMGGF